MAHLNTLIRAVAIQRPLASRVILTRLTKTPCTRTRPMIPVRDNEGSVPLADRWSEIVPRRGAGVQVPRQHQPIQIRSSQGRSIQSGHTLISVSFQLVRIARHCNCLAQSGCEQRESRQRPNGLGSIPTTGSELVGKCACILFSIRMQHRSRISPCSNTVGPLANEFAVSTPWRGSANSNLTSRRKRGAESM